jgi:threonine synthase
MTKSAMSHLEGSLSQGMYDADTLIGSDPADGRPLLVRYDMAAASKTLTKASIRKRHDGLWRWRELLPVRSDRFITSLGEGGTPLLPAPDLGRSFGINKLWLKAEGMNPTGSFKARGMATAVSRAIELGAGSFVVPSAGNAGAALASYGARAGRPVTVVMPTDAPSINLAEAQLAGALVVLVDGLIDDCGRVAAAIAGNTGAFVMSTLREPYRLEGKKTMGFEIVEHLGWTPPDVILYPTGGGTGLIGIWKAFAELEALGILDERRPRMIAVQAEGCAPIVRAFERNAEYAEPWEDARTRASGIRVPVSTGDRLMLRVLRESEGAAIAVSESDITRAQTLAGRAGHGYVAPETAAAIAGIDAARGSGLIAPSDGVVVLDTGIGAKYPIPQLPAPPVIRMDEPIEDGLSRHGLIASNQ